MTNTQAVTWMEVSCLKQALGSRLSDLDQSFHTGDLGQATGASSTVEP